MTRWFTVLAATVPGLVLAGVGLAHPPRLSAETATAWWQLHLVLLPLFPLLAGALWLLLRGERGVPAWLARIAAYGFATFYTGLDALAGIAAGIVVETNQRPSQASIDLGRIGNDLGYVGGYSFLAAAVLTAIALVRRDGPAAAPGAVLLVGGAVPFLSSHVYWPTGGFALVAIALGCGLLARTEARSRSGSPQTST